MKHTQSRAGFALPMAIFLLLVTTGAVMTTLAQTSTERRVSDSGATGERALVLAESGLARLDELGFDFASSVQDSARITMSDGFADVVMERVRAPTSTERAVFVVRARGVQTQGGWSDAPNAVRTVVRLGEWVEGTMQVHAGWTSLTGLRKNGNAGSLSGIDQCGVQSPVAGVAVPDSPGYSGHSGPVSGSPPIKSIGSTPGNAAAQVHIDWAGIVDGSALEPDYVYPDDGWPSDFDDWPVIYVDNPGSGFSLPDSGRGTLIVRGDLTISGSRSWDGIVLVGGELTSNGNNRVRGATITGLNVKLGETPGESDVGNGNKSYVYNSCNVQDAMQSQASLRILDNTWLDTWAQY
ncbi:MAG: hypothetical protein U5R14_15615 [Gemmatimonadota bacterium]|nr:hypothetical protein [Gemmatimonadota bacterium]